MTNNSLDTKLIIAINLIGVKYAFYLPDKEWEFRAQITAKKEWVIFQVMPRYRYDGELTHDQLDAVIKFKEEEEAARASEVQL